MDKTHEKILSVAIFIASLNINAAIGPLPIYLNTEYRTQKSCNWANSFNYFFK